MINVGIIGCGRIAQVRHIPEYEANGNARICGFYDINHERAGELAKKYQAKAYDSYEELLADDAIDAVSVCAANSVHAAITIAALEAGKHVLCEKPMVLERAQAEELFGYAKERNLILFEGIKTAYCPGFHKLLGIAGSGTVGSIRNIEACFTKLEKTDSRELTNQVYGGSFIELGSYVMLPILKLYGREFQEIRFDTIKGENGLDLFTRVSLRYPEGIATATCGLGVKSEGRLLIAGTKGYIVAEAPWWKTAYFEVHYENAGEVEKYSERFLGDGLRYEISDCLSMINGNGSSEFKLTRGESVALAGVMEEFMRMEKRGG